MRKNSEDPDSISREAPRSEAEWAIGDREPIFIKIAPRRTLCAKTARTRIVSPFEAPRSEAKWANGDSEPKERLFASLRVTIF